MRHFGRRPERMCCPESTNRALLGVWFCTEIPLRATRVGHLPFRLRTCRDTAAWPMRGSEVMMLANIRKAGLCPRHGSLSGFSSCWSSNYACRCRPLMRGEDTPVLSFIHPCALCLIRPRTHELHVSFKPVEAWTHGQGICFSVGSACRSGGKSLPFATYLLIIVTEY